MGSGNGMIFSPKLVFYNNLPWEISIRDFHEYGDEKYNKLKDIRYVIAVNLSNYILDVNYNIDIDKSYKIISDMNMCKGKGINYYNTIVWFNDDEFGICDKEDLLNINDYIGHGYKILTIDEHIIKSIIE